MSFSVASFNDRIHRLSCSTSRLIPLSVRQQSMEYLKLLDEIESLAGDSTVEALKVFINAVVHTTWVSVALTSLHRVIRQFLRKLPFDQSKEISMFVLLKAVPRTKFFDQVYYVRLHLAFIYKTEQNWSEAVKHLDYLISDYSVHQLLTDDRKLNIFIKMTYLCLENNDLSTAQVYINRASVVECKCDNIALKYNLSLNKGRILEELDKYVEAVQFYFELSNKTIITRKQRITALKKSLICSVLMPFSPLRNQMLNKLLKDRRCQCFHSFSIFNKILQEVLISSDEVKKLHSILAPYQNKKIVDGFTKMDRAIMEHNFFLVSQMYDTIQIEELGVLFHVDACTAEKMTAFMITKNRLEGSIDQLNGVVQFGSQDSLPVLDKEI